jgi:hypothetical protein
VQPGDKTEDDQGEEEHDSHADQKPTPALTPCNVRSRDLTPYGWYVFADQEGIEKIPCGPKNAIPFRNLSMPFDNGALPTKSMVHVEPKRHGVDRKDRDGEIPE